MSDDEGAAPSLRADTLAALASFMAERAAAVAAEADEADVAVTGSTLATREDWQMVRARAAVATCVRGLSL